MKFRPSTPEDEAWDDYVPQMPEHYENSITVTNPQTGLWSPNHDVYMKYWPLKTQPVSMVIICNQWGMDTMEIGGYTEYLGWGLHPEMKLTMPNGATMEKLYNDPIENGLDESFYEGDWSGYFSEVEIPIEETKDTIEEVIDSAYWMQEMDMKDTEW